MGNKGIGNLIQGGGATVGIAPEAAACAAFSVAVDAFCGEAKTERTGTFHDHFLEALNLDPIEGRPLANALEPDTSAERASAPLSLAAVVAAGTGRGADAARRVLQVRAAGGGAPGPVRSASAWSALASKWLASPADEPPVRVPGTAYAATAFEVKGPDDTYEPGEMEEYQSLTPDREAVEVGCVSCGEACADGNSCC